ncbi:MAG TPA: hypothetical protein VNU93_08915 [Verrucomicrobiae bacterium]|nr:hypothetical protein [Verrucomicrobiae bacterium]
MTFIPYWMLQLYWVAWLGVTFIVAFAFGCLMLKPYWDKRFGGELAPWQGWGGQ